MAFDEDLELPRDLGPYTLLRRLAVGGMAEVYVGKTNGLGGFEKQVAVKLIHPRFSEDEHFVQMLVQEAKVAVLLTHVNIAQTFDLGRADDQYYIVMELIEGADAYRVMRKCAEQKRAMPIDVATFIVAEMLQGLDYAHRKAAPDGSPLHIVHRDISPQNVLISHSGEVKIVDFGIAKAASRSENTEAGVIKGKYYYMSPEQAWGDPIDHRADIFSTGVVLYELLTGRMLYTDENVVVLLDKVRKADIAPPERRRPSIPKALSDIVMRALGKNPNERYQSAQEFAGALQQFLYQTSPTFSAARLGELMGGLFPEESQRHSGQIQLPAPSGEEKLPTPVPPKPQAGASMADFDDEDESTRHDVLPFKRAASALLASQKAAAAPAPPSATMRPAGRGRDASQPTARISAPAEAPLADTGPRRELEGPTATDEQTIAGEWEDPTHLRDKANEFDDSTLIDSGGMSKQLEQMLKVAPPKAPQVFESGRGRVNATFVKPSAAPPRPPVVPKPSAPTPKAPSVPPPPAANAWQTAKQPVMPASRPLAAQPVPRVSAAPQPAPRVSAAPQPAPPTVPTLSQPPSPPRQVAIHAAETALVQAPDGDSPDSTQPFMKGGAPPAWPQHPGQPPSSFAPPPPAAMVPASHAFTSSTGPYASIPVGADPFAAPPSPASQPSDLGRPRPLRWLLSVLGLIVIAIGAAYGVASLMPPPPPPTLEIISAPPGATVLLDGAALPGVTPLSLGDGLEVGRSYTVEVRLAGHQPWTATFVATAGTTRQEVPLMPLATVLHVETSPPGAAITVDGASAGMSPLDLSSMRVGQRVVVRATLAGFAPAQTEVVIVEGTTPASLTLSPIR